MLKYIFAYYNGKIPESPEEGEKHAEKFKTWIGTLGDAVINPGTPLVRSRLVSSEGVSEDVVPKALLGYSIIQAESMDAALEMAKVCPHLELGTIEVAQIMEM